MRAARLLSGASSLHILDVPMPEPIGDAIRVRVIGAGVCHSDLHVLDGAFAEMVHRPVTLGHEIAGVVDATGPDASDLEISTPVVVMVGWGCGSCAWCVAGHEQLCPSGVEAGSHVDGGFAEHILVPHRRHVVPLGRIDPLDATPFGCAALCAYAAVRRVQPRLSGGGSLAVIGAGGLGQHAIHYARQLTGAQVVAIDPRSTALVGALAAGAHVALEPGAVTPSLVQEVTHGLGCPAVLDFVGSDESLALAATLVGRQGIIALLGLAGGTLSFGFDTLAAEATITTVVAGTIRDLHDVVRLAQQDRYAIALTTYPLDAVNVALADLRAGLIDGRAVVIPGDSGR